MANPPFCHFCFHKLHEVSHLVRADGGAMICLACARKCIATCEAENAPPVSRLRRTEVAAPPRLLPDTRHLDGFLYYGRGRIRTGTPDPVMPWLCEFLDVYEMAVLDAVKDTADCRDSLRRSQRVSEAFDRMMLPYRGDGRRAYLGAVFDRLLGRSIREGFAYHVDMTVLTPVEGAAT